MLHLGVTNCDAFVKANRLAHLKPWVLSNCLNRWPTLWSLLKDCTDQVSDLSADEMWNYVLAHQDLFVQLGCIWVFKRKEATDECVQNDSTAP